MRFRLLSLIVPHARTCFLLFVLSHGCTAASHNRLAGWVGGRSENQNREDFARAKMDCVKQQNDAHSEQMQNTSNITHASGSAQPQRNGRTCHKEQRKPQPAMPKQQGALHSDGIRAEVHAPDRAPSTDTPPTPNTAHIPEFKWSVGFSYLPSPENGPSLKVFASSLEFPKTARSSALDRRPVRSAVHRRIQEWLVDCAVFVRSHAPRDLMNCGVGRIQFLPKETNPLAAPHFKSDSPWPSERIFVWPVVCRASIVFSAGDGGGVYHVKSTRSNWGCANPADDQHNAVRLVRGSDQDTRNADFSFCCIVLLPSWANHYLLKHVELWFRDLRFIDAFFFVDSADARMVVFDTSRVVDWLRRRGVSSKEKKVN